MSVDKKSNREKLPQPDTRNTKHQGREQQNEKEQTAKEKGKVKKVNYVVKDLPIY